MHASAYLSLASQYYTLKLVFLKTNQASSTEFAGFENFMQRPYSWILP